jgi:hypothetical protein
MPPYAVDTKVPVDRTRSDIEKLVLKYKCSQYGSAIDNDARRAMVQFTMRRRRISFELPLPDPILEQQTRSRWRALYLAIKAKLECVESGIESFDEAFLAHIVMPDGRRFGEISVPQLEHYTDEK